MTITEKIEDIPKPVICSIQRSNNATSLTLKSVPFQKDIVEYSADLQAWDEIDDSVESQGTETVFVDTDAARIAGERAFYRYSRAPQAK